jgi:hypothetical protein
VIAEIFRAAQPCGWASGPCGDLDVVGARPALGRTFRPDESSTLRRSTARTSSTASTRWGRTRSTIDQIPITDALRVVENRLTDAAVSEGVPIAPVEVVVVMKLLAGRTQDLADVEAIIDSGADRELLKAAVTRAVPDCAETLERLFANVDRSR